jgi:hypothetical protein
MVNYISSLLSAASGVVAWPPRSAIGSPQRRRNSASSTSTCWTWRTSICRWSCRPTATNSRPEIKAIKDPITERLAEADAYVVVTPEYNHSFPAALKNVIDWHLTEWAAKPVGFVSYGGISGALRAIEHLRGVFAELHTVTIRETVSFAGAWGHWDNSGNWPRSPSRPTPPPRSSSSNSTGERIPWPTREKRPPIRHEGPMYALLSRILSE